MRSDQSIFFNGLDCKWNNTIRKMKVNFVIRQTKKKNDGCVPIEMTICVKGKRRYVSTGREVKPSDFNSKTQTVKGAII